MVWSICAYKALGLHGLGVPGATIFASPIGLGASWNPEVVPHYRIFTIDPTFLIS